MDDGRLEHILAARRILRRDLQELFLTADQRLALFRHHPMIGTVRSQFARLHIIRQADGQNFLDQPLLQIGLLDRKSHFDAAAQVAIHPIGRTD